MKDNKFYYTKLGTLYRKICGWITSFFEYFIDKKNTGVSLRGTVKSTREKSATSEPIRYAGLKAMFSDEVFDDNDSFLDIGCGKGRALGYINSIGFKGKITGIEYNPDVCSAAQEWAKNYDNINVLCGDAFELDFNDYNVFYMYNPFYDEDILRLIEKIENESKHDVRVFYYGDNKWGKHFAKRENWQKQKRAWVFKKGIICVQYYPQRYTIWKYTP